MPASTSARTSSRSARAATSSSARPANRFVSIGSRKRDADEALHQRGHLPVSGRSEVGDDVVHLLGSDGGERDDRVAELDRQAGEAEALLPQQLVLLAAALEHLACAARKHQDVLPV